MKCRRTPGKPIELTAATKNRTAEKPKSPLLGSHWGPDARRDLGPYRRSAAGVTMPVLLAFPGSRESLGFPNVVVLGRLARAMDRCRIGGWRVVALCVVAAVAFVAIRAWREASRSTRDILAPRSSALN
jgi:hypothetical protein